MNFALTFAWGDSDDPVRSVFTATIAGDQVAEPAARTLALAGLFGLAGIGRQRAA